MIKSTQPTTARRGLREYTNNTMNPTVKKAEASKEVSSTTAKSMTATLRAKASAPATKSPIRRPITSTSAKKQSDEGQAEAIILLDSVDVLDHLGIDPFAPELRGPVICAEQPQEFSCHLPHQKLSSQETLSHPESTVACHTLTSPSANHSQQGASKQAKCDTVREDQPPEAHGKGKPVQKLCTNVEYARIL
jgi:hypothetical protein